MKPGDLLILSVCIGHKLCFCVSGLPRSSDFLLLDWRARRTYGVHVAEKHEITTDKARELAPMKIGLFSKDFMDDANLSQPGILAQMGPRLLRGGPAPNPLRIRRMWRPPEYRRRRILFPVKAGNNEVNINVISNLD
jgi:hypothetical protein